MHRSLDIANEPYVALKQTVPCRTLAFQTVSAGYNIVTILYPEVTV